MPPPTTTKASQKDSASAHKPAPAKPTAKKAAKTVSADEAFAKLVDHLRAHPNNRPTTRKALERHIPSVVGLKVAVDVARALISRLESAGVATISDKAIQYKIPKRKKSA
jgi:3-methyladenine DNA glycosylase/8-oxoguanine DNA glycosylase